MCILLLLLLLPLSQQQTTAVLSNMEKEINESKSLFHARQSVSSMHISDAMMLIGLMELELTIGYESRHIVGIYMLDSALLTELIMALTSM